MTGKPGNCGRIGERQMTYLAKTKTGPLMRKSLPFLGALRAENRGKVGSA